MSLIWVIDNHLHNDVLGVWGNVRDQLLYPNKLLRLEVELHVSCMPRKSSLIRLITILFEVFKQLLIRCSHDVMNLVDLVKFVVSREVETERGSQRRRSQLPKYPFCTHSNRLLADTQGLCTIWLRYTL